MKPSEQGRRLIEYYEGLRLKAYPDPATGGEPWTIGIGHTGNVKKGDVITEAYARELLKDDLAKFEDGVTKLVKVGLNQNQFDALVSFSFNVGLQNLATSTLLQLINANQFDKAAKQFGRWNKAAGKVMKGLTKRRAAEAWLFLGWSAKEAVALAEKN
jgi:lysozyme